MCVLLKPYLHILLSKKIDIGIFRFQKRTLLTELFIGYVRLCVADCYPSDIRLSDLLFSQIHYIAKKEKCIIKMEMQKKKTIIFINASKIKA